MTSIRPTLLALAVLATWSPASGACRGFGTQLECDLGAGRTVIGTQTAAEPRYARAFRLQPLNSAAALPSEPRASVAAARARSCRTWAPIRASAGRSATRRTATEPAQAVGAPDAELLHARLERRPLEAQPRRGAVRAAEDPVGLAQRRAGWLRARWPRAYRRPQGPASGPRNSGDRHAERAPGAQDDGALDRVLELAHVPGPGVARRAPPSRPRGSSRSACSSGARTSARSAGRAAGCPRSARAAAAASIGKTFSR